MWQKLGKFLLNRNHGQLLCLFSFFFVVYIVNCRRQILNLKAFGKHLAAAFAFVLSDRWNISCSSHQKFLSGHACANFFKHRQQTVKIGGKELLVVVCTDLRVPYRINSNDFDAPLISLYCHQFFPPEYVFMVLFRLPQFLVKVSERPWSGLIQMKFKRIWYLTKHRSFTNFKQNAAVY